MDNHDQSPAARINRYKQRLTRLKTERSSWLSGWRDIARYIYPWILRRLDDQADRQADGSAPRLENSAPAWAVNVLAAGLANGMTPQSRKWFRLSLPDGAVAKDNHAVKTWLHDAEDAINAALHRSNAYDALQSLFLSLSLFGTAVLFVDMDEADGVRFYTPPNGTYVIANSGRQQVATFIRELRLTVNELIDRFGRDAVSDHVRRMADRGDMDTLIDVVQVVEPSPWHNPDALYSVDAAPYRGVFFELAQPAGKAKFLAEHGYYEMPIMAARWELYDGDVYGYGPGHKAIGDCKDLRRNMRTQEKLLDQLVMPPLLAPVTAKNQGGVKITPGAVTYYDPTLGPSPITPLVQPNPNGISALIAQEEAIKQRIYQAFYVDVFLAISQAPVKSGVTATEILERYQEKLLMLGPVLERVNNDLLDPMIKRVFGLLYRSGRIPDPPEEIESADFKIEYVSAVALGQQATTVTAIEALAGFTGTIAGAFPEALDLVNTDAMIRTYAGLHDLPPGVIRDDRVVARIRADRARQDDAAQQAASGEQLVNAAKLMSETNTGGSNLLTNTMDAMGYMTGMGV